MRRNGIVLAVFAGMLTATVAEAKILQVATDRELALAISSAGNGDTIELAPGNYGQVIIIGGKYNQVIVGNTRITKSVPNLSTAVTIKSQSLGNKASIKNVDIRGSNHWSFSDLDIRPGARGKSFFAVKLRGANNSFLNSTIDYGNSTNWNKTDWNKNAGRGVWLAGANNTVQNNFFQSVNMGVTVDYQAPNAKVSNNTIDGLSGDGFRALGDFGLYENNLIKNFKAVNGNHDDCLQSFSKQNGVIGAGSVTGVVVRGNVCIGAEDQSANFYSTPSGYVAFQGEMVDWVIEDNVLVSSGYNGITLAKATNAVIRNNTILDDNLALKGANSVWIRINGGQSGSGALSNTIVDNLANVVVDTGFANLSNNIEINYSNYDDWFVDWRNQDFTLKSTAPVSGVGAVLGSVGASGGLSLMSASAASTGPAGFSLMAASAASTSIASFGRMSAAVVPFQTGAQLAVPVPMAGVLLLSGLGMLAALRARSSRQARRQPV